MKEYNTGWIKLHRKIKDSWIWHSDNRIKWWLDILMTVNHANSKVLIRGQLIECKRGQSLRSLQTWAKEWGVTKKTVRDFFKLLHGDSMINIENLKITTRLTVCNYDSYQGGVNGEETMRKRKAYPNKNKKENNEETGPILKIKTLTQDAK